eukprot:CAMPEP_0182497346 /NCGR_PEP_ID=MMETSP1321-20130603/5840_1 /TAXON_ID=91990 /ORGANISM="Bolidomonas sp., Strain RCC1657" /LENGTH=218 /DNA_ID=CAMNT_0024701195 /DNA_START=191 /DNA_END=847 /DNA_ORIENTATION=+
MTLGILRIGPRVVRAGKFLCIAFADKILEGAVSVTALVLPSEEEEEEEAGWALFETAAEMGLAFWALFAAMAICAGAALFLFRKLKRVSLELSALKAKVRDKGEMVPPLISAVAANPKPLVITPVTALPPVTATAATATTATTTAPQSKTLVDSLLLGFTPAKDADMVVSGKENSFAVSPRRRSKASISPLANSPNVDGPDGKPVRDREFIKEYWKSA